MKTSIAIGALALAAIAGSANASVIPLYDFSTSFSSPNATSPNSGEGPVTGSNPFSLYGWNRSSSSTSPRNMVSGTTGSVTMSNIARAAAYTNFAVTTDYNALPQPSVNLSGTTAIEFNVTAYTGAATTWTVFVYDSTGSFLQSLPTTVSGTGLQSFDVSSFFNVVPTTLDWSSIVSVDMEARTVGNAQTAQASSFTFNSFNAVIPTPGAAAMLGLGGLLAARRRR
jgi:hypothetical protein